MKIAAKIALAIALTMPSAALATKMPRIHVPWTMVVSAHGTTYSVIMATGDICKQTAETKVLELTEKARIKDRFASATCFDPHTGKSFTFRGPIAQKQEQHSSSQDPVDNGPRSKPWRDQDRLRDAGKKGQMNDGSKNVHDAKSQNPDHMSNKLDKVDQASKKTQAPQASDNQ